jgi:hypothetical protein
MNLQATVKGIAASGGIRPDSHITACPVTAIKAGPVALTLVAATLSIVLGGPTVAIARVIEGRTANAGRSDLSPSSNLMGCVTVRKDVVALKADSVCAPPFPRGPLETCTLHDQRLLVSPTGRCGNADHTLTGQRRYTDERERPSKRFGLMQGGRRVTSRSGGGYGLWPATALQQTSPHYRRNLGNPCAEKVRPHRARSLFLNTAN